MAKTVTCHGTTKPITLEICGCGKHGRFLLSDGRRSVEFASKEDARQVLECCALVDRFQSLPVLVPILDSGVEIFAEINASSLAPTRSGLGHLEKVISTWNMAKAMQPKLSIMDFHHVSDALYDYQAFAA